MSEVSTATTTTTYPRPSLAEIISLAKRRGFVYPTSEIYGGIANTYDYGPLGAELLRQIKNSWWQTFISNRDDVVGLDTAIVLHPQTWVASGHVDSFNDPLVEDTVTHQRYRADHLVETWIVAQSLDSTGRPATLTGDQLRFWMDHLAAKKVENLSVSELGEIIKFYQIPSPDGHPVTEPKQFNLLFETSVGSVNDAKSHVYLRGETAQGIFSDFKQVLDTTRVKLPFGIGNIGKSFRNEITTGQFVFRTLEFEQAEIEYFFDPTQNDWAQLLDDWKQAMWQWVTQELGIQPNNLQWRRHTDQERSHYSRDTYDLDYRYPFGFKELWGVAYRTDYDLTQHMKYSGQSLEYSDPQSNRAFIPHVIEPALGINRVLLMMLCDAYWSDPAHQRLVLKLRPEFAPHQVAVFPLLKNKAELVTQARQVFDHLRTKFRLAWDDRGNIGKRYLYQDEVGTPWCVTIDFQSLTDATVTVRDRDTTRQERVPIDMIHEYLLKKLAN